MKNIKFIIPLVALAIVGCATVKSILTPAAVEQITATTAAWGIATDKNVAPYLQAATPVICSLAGTTVLDPATVVSALENSSANELKTPTALIVINSILATYSVVYDAYGSNVTASQMQPYLAAMCNGLTKAIGGKLAGTKLTAPGPTVATKWPYVK